jgi:hypothetical protein
VAAPLSEDERRALGLAATVASAVVPSSPPAQEEEAEETAQDEKEPAVASDAAVVDLIPTDNNTESVPPAIPIETPPSA